MTFELTRELVDQIIFAMEDQDQDYVLDLEIMEIVPAEEADEDNEQRFAPLPWWESVDGYNLMERFTGTLHNPVYRQRLRTILDSGRGVFRQFKDCVKERPEIERLWYHYKEREMRNLVVEWYGDVCDALGLDHVEPDFVETEDLVLSDFAVQHADGPIEPQLAEMVTEQDTAALRELFTDCAEDYRLYLERRLRAQRPPLWGDAARVTYATTPAEQPAGFLWAQHDRLSGGCCIGVVVQLYVVPEFRGLGIASTLISAYLERAHQQGVERLLMCLPGSSAVLARTLQRIGFDPLMTTMELDLNQWGSENR